MIQTFHNLISVNGELVPAPWMGGQQNLPMSSYYDHTSPDGAYNEWKKNWVPPAHNIKVQRGKVLMEFAPFGTTGTIFEPTEKASYQGKVIYDSTGELQCGDEVALEGNEAEEFKWEGRTLSVVDKSDILMLVLD